MRAPLNLLATLSEMERLTAKETALEKNDTFSSRRSNCNTVPGLEKLSLGDCVVHFRLEDVEEAVLAYLLPGFWSP
jgi:hypothetical protein